jgi:hypothetical protein
MRTKIQKNKRKLKPGFNNLEPKEFVIFALQTIFYCNLRATKE